MGVALAVVPGIAAAWMWVAPAARGRLHALGQLLAGGGAMLLVGGAWPALVELTPASSRPWIAGTSDNRVLSLIFEYNGLGRVDGQAGGPAGAPGGGQNNMFGGGSGPLRLLNSALGGQVGWLLGFALVTTLAMVLASRLRRRDPRTGWLIAVGGSFLAGAVLFSFASGIFHPYYVSLLAPFLAALVGAGAGELFGRRLSARVVAPVAIAAGVIVELVIRGHYSGPAPLAGAGAGGPRRAHDRRARARALATGTRGRAGGRTRGAACAPACVGLRHPLLRDQLDLPLRRPRFGRDRRHRASAWAGAASCGGFAAPAGRPAPRCSAPRVRARAPAQARARPARARRAVRALFGSSGSGTSSAGPGSGGPPPGAGAGFGGGSPGGPGGGGGLGASPFGGNASSLNKALSYIDTHGGGTLAISSQSGAAASIIARSANVVGIGGFSGRESEVTRSWLAEEVRSGKIRWVLAEESGPGQIVAASGASGGLGALGGTGFPRGSSSALLGGAGAGGPGGETRVGSKKVMAVVEKACSRVELTSSGSTTTGSSGSTSAGSLYDCSGDAQAIAG